MSGFNLNDYVDVAERIQLFYKQYKDGRLATRSIDYREWPEPGILAIAEAYRTADDPHPGVGTAWEPVPGKTQFTRYSEVQNAETAAWGRAIVACGIGAKPGQLASREEVEARQGITESPRSASPPAQGRPQQPTAKKALATPNGDTDTRWKPPSDPDTRPIDNDQRRQMFGIATRHGLTQEAVRKMLKAGTGSSSTSGLPQWQYARLMQEIDAVKVPA